VGAGGREVEGARRGGAGDEPTGVPGEEAEDERPAVAGSPDAGGVGARGVALAGPAARAAAAAVAGAPEVGATVGGGVVALAGWEPAADCGAADGEGSAVGGVVRTASQPSREGPFADWPAAGVPCVPAALAGEEPPAGAAGAGVPEATGVGAPALAAGVAGATTPAPGGGVLSPGAAADAAAACPATAGAASPGTPGTTAVAGPTPVAVAGRATTGVVRGTWRTAGIGGATCCTRAAAPAVTRCSISAERSGARPAHSRRRFNSRACEKTNSARIATPTRAANAAIAPIFVNVLESESASGKTVMNPGSV
jgi:hypothetical protein